jgi:nicotinic acid mononucleotide adenylyltransferase
MLELLTAIHATPHMMTMNFAGAGAQALAWLHSVGGSSRTILEATDRYVPSSLMEAVGYMPEKFTSVEVGKALAQNAYRRARHLAKPELPVFGVGCTATIATDRAKKGDHRCVVSICDPLGMTSYELVLVKGARDRQGEEDLVSWLILYAIAEACGVYDLPKLSLVDGEAIQQTFRPVAALSELLEGKTQWLKIEPNGNLQAGNMLPDIALLSGSFNPLHEGHKELSKVASTHLAKDVLFELPLINADKPPLDPLVLRKRAVQFLGFDTLLLSRAPFFHQKTSLYPNSTFVLGADTAERLVAPRYYSGSLEKMQQALEDLRQKGSRFLVAGRSSKGDFRTLEDIAIPPEFLSMFEEIPQEHFQMDISSTEIRRNIESKE